MNKILLILPVLFVLFSVSVFPDAFGAIPTREANTNTHTWSGSASGGGIVVTAPSNLGDNDIWIIAVALDGSAGSPTIADDQCASGFTRNLYYDHSANEIAIFYCREDSTPDNQVTVNWTGNEGYYIMTYSIAGVHEFGSPFAPQNSLNFGDSTTSSALGVSGLKANAYGMAFHSIDRDRITSGQADGGTNWTTIDCEESGGAGGVALCISEDTTGGTSSDDSTHTLSTGDTWIGAQIFFREPEPVYVVDLVDVYESSSSTLGSGTEIFVDCDLEVSETCSTIADASFQSSADFTNTHTTTPQSFEWSVDGTKAWSIDSGDDIISEYTCGTAWTTPCTHASSDLDVSTDLTTIMGMDWKIDGSAFFIIDDSTDEINEYECSTKWDASSCTRQDIRYDASTECITPTDLQWSPDGLTLMVSCTAVAEINQYTAELPYELNNLVATDLESWNHVIEGFHWTWDGRTVFTIDSSSDTVKQTPCEEAWIIKSCDTAKQTSLSVTGQIPTPVDVSVEPNGEDIFVFGTTGGASDVVARYLHEPQLKAGNTYRFEVEVDNIGGVAGSPNDLTVDNAVGGNFKVGAYQFSTLTVTSQSVQGLGVDIKPDGTRLFVSDADNDDINEYECTVPFDVSSCTFTDATSVITNSPNVWNILFSDDGLKLYIMDNSQVDEYSCSSSWDMSTCTTYNDNLAIPSSLDIIPFGMDWSPDGKFFFITGETNDIANRYECRVAWDVSTCERGEKSGDITPEASVQPRGIDFSPDGLEMFIYGSFGNFLMQYSCTDAWHPNTCTTLVDSWGSEEGFSSLQGGTMSPNGEWFIVAHDSGVTATVYSYKLSGLFGDKPDSFIDTLTDASSPLSISGQGLEPRCIEWNDDGTKMYICDDQNNEIDEYNCTAYDVSTCTSASSPLDVSTEDTQPVGIAWNNDGTKIFMVGTAGNTVEEYGTCTAYDVSTCSYVDGLSIASQDTSPEDIEWKSDGSGFLIAGVVGVDLTEYSCTTDWDLSTCSYVTSTEFDLSGVTSFPKGVAWTAGGYGLMIYGTGAPNGIALSEFECATAYDHSSCYEVPEFFSTSGFESSSEGVAFNGNYTKLYIVGSNDDEVVEFDITSPTGLAGCGTNTDWGSVVHYHSDLKISGDAGTLCSLSATTGTDEFWFIVTMEADSNIDDITFTISDGAGTTDTSTVTTLDVYKPLMVPYSFDVYDSTSTSLDTGTAICTDRLMVDGHCSGYDLEGMSHVDSTSVTGVETLPFGLDWSLNGTKLFFSGQDTGEIHEYSCSTAFDASTCTDSVDPLNVSGQDTAPRGITWNLSGDKIFMLGSVGNDVNEYACTTLFDVSTCTFTDATSVATQDPDPVDVKFSYNGRSMFILDDTGNDISHYTCTARWDASTCTTFVDSTATGTTTPTGFDWSLDGTVLFVLDDSTNDDIAIMRCAESFDMSTCLEYDTFSVTTPDAIPVGVAFDAYGQKVFTMGDTDNEINEWDLNPLVENTQYRVEVDVYSLGELSVTPTSFAFDDIYTGKINSVIFSAENRFLSDDTTPMDVAWNPDGTLLYIFGVDFDEIDEYDCSAEPWVVASCTANNSLTAVGASDSFFWKPDGTKIFLGDWSGDDVEEFNCSVAWDVSTCTNSGDPLDISGQETGIDGIHFNPDGTKMFISGIQGDDVTEYTCTTGYDVSTCTVVDSFSVFSEETAVWDVHFNNEGTEMFIVGDGSDDLNQYSCTTAWDVSTCSHTVTIDLPFGDDSPSGIFFNPDFTKMYVSELTDGWITTYDIDFSNGLGDSSATAVGSTGCNANTNWTDAIDDTKNSLQSSGTTCTIASGSSATYWGLITAPQDSTPNYDFVGFSISDGTTSASITKNMMFTFQDFAGAQTHNRNISNPMSMTDALTMAVIHYESDAVSVTDSFTTIHTATRTASDPKSFTSQVTKKMTHLESDQMSMTDATNLSTIHTESDQMSIIDTITVTKLKTISTPMSITDQTNLTITHPESDQMSMTTAITLATTHTESDQMSMTDSVTTTKFATRTASDQMSMTDAINMSIIHPESDQMSMTDSVTTTRMITQPVSNPMSMTDAISMSIIHPESDQMSMTDSVTTTRMITQPVSNPMSITTALTLTTIHTESDQMSFTDIVNATQIFGGTEYNRSASDPMSMTTALTLATTHLESDNMSITDSITTQFMGTYQQQESDAMSMTDSVTTSHIVPPTTGGGGSQPPTPPTDPEPIPEPELPPLPIPTPDIGVPFELNQLIVETDRLDDVTTSSIPVTSELQIQWLADDTITITNVQVEHSPFDIQILETPTIIQRDDFGVSEEQIVYQVLAPNKICDDIITLDCLAPITYEIPVTVTGKSGGNVVVSQGSIVIDNSDRFDPVWLLFLSLLAIPILTFVYYRNTRKAKATKTRPRIMTQKGGQQTVQRISQKSAIKIKQKDAPKKIIQLKKRPEPKKVIQKKPDNNSARVIKKKDTKKKKFMGQ